MHYINLAADWEIMADTSTPYSRFNNSWYKLVFNETMLLLSRDEDFFLTLPQTLNNWKIRIKFLSDRSISALPVEMEFPNDEIHIKLTNWYSDAGVQTAEPLRIQSKDGKLKVLVVIKTFANRTHNHRTLMLSIWKITE